MPAAVPEPPLQPSPASGPEKTTAFERTKEESAHLRGTLAAELHGGAEQFSEPAKNLLKFHGIYQQDDRDTRKEGKRYSFMVRCKLPGGRLDADQYLALDGLAERYGNGSLRITTRGDFQFHGILKGELRAAVATVNETLVTTFGACGDLVRNVVCCPAPLGDPLREEIYRHARAISDRFLPRTGAYHEIWLEGEKLGSEVPFLEAPAGEAEPIYGQTYLPRKLKIALASPGDNCVDVYTQDVGLVAIEEGGALAGFNVLAGGGMGATPSKEATFPRLADPIGFAKPEEAAEVVEAIVRLFRDAGHRVDRKRARLKYLLHDWGVERFRAELEKRLGRPLPPPRPVPPMDLHLHLGWHRERREGGDSGGRWTLGLSIENGRLKDEEGRSGRRLKSGLRAVVEAFRPEVHLTPNQDLLLVGLASEDRARVEALLSAHRIPLPHQLSNLRVYSMACPAFPSCGLAITEAERALPGLIDQLEREVARLGLADERLAVRMTGCPNGCARPYVADLAFVGRAPHRYDVFAGGRLDGTRMNVLYREGVPAADLLETVLPLFVLYRGERRPGEAFGDFCARLGVEGLRSRTADPLPAAAGPERPVAEVVHA